MADIIQIRRDIEQNWSSANPTLAQGEIAFELDTYRIKIGNAIDDWATLNYFLEDTNTLPEGTNNLYFTQERARDSVSASGDLDYNAGTGVFSFTERTDQEVRDLLSASGDLSYNSATGEFSVTTYKSTDFDTDFGTKTTDNLSEGTGNLYFTTGRIDDHLTGGTGVDYTTGTISIGQDVSTTSNVEFADVVITGNLTVQGTETIIETATLQVEDQNIELGKVDNPDNTTANTGGLTVLAGADGDKTWKWLSATDSWTSSEHVNVVSGKEYKVNGTTVLTNNTLGSGVTASSLTSVGTLNSGSIASGFGNIDIGTNTFTGNGSSLTDVDAVTLEGQDGDHYLDYGNFTNTPTNLSEFNNDENFITLNDLSASGDLSYNSSTGEFSVTTYKSTDFDTDFGNKDTDNLSEGTSNLYFTTGRIDDHLTGGTGVNYDTGTISIGQSVGTGDSVQFGSVSISADVLLDSSTESTTVAATETTIAQFAASGHTNAKFIVGIKDTATGDSQVSELLVTHDGTDAFSTEYGVVFTGNSALASFVVDIDAGNVRLRASTISANETVYTVSQTLLG